MPRPISSLLLETLRAAIDARAAGWWRVRGDRLVQVAFSAAPDMPADVAEAFASATVSVGLTETGLAIVKAATTGAPIFSHAEALPPQEGSGLWLRRFDAERSVAVPVGPRRRDGLPGWVVSVALGAAPPDDATVAARLTAATDGWPEPGSA